MKYVDLQSSLDITRTLIGCKRVLYESINTQLSVAPSAESLFGKLKSDLWGI